METVAGFIHSVVFPESRQETSASTRRKLKCVLHYVLP